MYCKYCGKVIDNDSTFCMYCGKSLSNNTNEEQISAKIKSNGKDKEIRPDGSKKDIEKLSRNIVKNLLFYLLPSFVSV